VSVMRWQLSEFDVLGDTVLMPWMVEEVAGAVCGVDCL